jgi:hypothetical protein
MKSERKQSVICPRVQNKVRIANLDLNFFKKQTHTHTHNPPHTQKLTRTQNPKNGFTRSLKRFEIIIPQGSLAILRKMKSLTTKGAKDWEADSWIYQREPRSAALGSDDGSQCFHHSDWVCFAVRNLDGNAQFYVLKPTNNV